jgi:hypothetical protein
MIDCTVYELFKHQQRRHLGFGAQSTYRGRDEIPAVYLYCQSQLFTSTYHALYTHSRIRSHAPSIQSHRGTKVV